MVDINAIFTQAGVDTSAFSRKSPKPGPYLRELVKLLPFFDRGEAGYTDVQKYVEEVRASNTDESVKVVSLEVLDRCYEALKLSKAASPEATDHVIAYNAGEIYNNLRKGTKKPAPKTNGSDAAYNYSRLLAGEPVNGKLLVDDANYQLLLKDSEILGRLLDQETVNGQRLIAEIPFNALEWIKANDQKAYEKAIAATTADLKAKAEEKVAAALAEQEKLLREQIYAQLGLTTPESKADNPAGLPAPEQTAPTFTPVGVADAVGKDVAEELKAKKKKESDADFLDRMKALICENKEMENADYQRLLDLKGKNNVIATELVELFETSPEAPQGDKK